MEREEQMRGDGTAKYKMDQAEEVEEEGEEDEWVELEIQEELPKEVETEVETHTAGLKVVRVQEEVGTDTEEVKEVVEEMAEQEEDEEEEEEEFTNQIFYLESSSES